MGIEIVKSVIFLIFMSIFLQFLDESKTLQILNQLSRVVLILKVRPLTFLLDPISFGESIRFSLCVCVSVFPSIPVRQ